MNFYIFSISQCFVILLIHSLVSPNKYDFLHYDDLAISALQRYCFDTAADAHDDFLQQRSILELSFIDDEIYSQNKDNNLEDVQPFHFISDKIIF